MNGTEPAVSELKVVLPEKKAVPVTDRLVVEALVTASLVVVAFVATKLVEVPLVALKFVNSAVVAFSNVAKKLVEVALVKIPVEGVLAPMGVLSIVPPEMVRLSATRASAKVPLNVGVKVCVEPDETILIPMLVSEVVANVWVATVKPLSEVMAEDR